MDFVQILLDAYTDRVNSKDLTGYFVRQFKIAKRDFFFSYEEFHKGCKVKLDAWNGLLSYEPWLTIKHPAGGECLFYPKHYKVLVENINKAYQSLEIDMQIVIPNENTPQKGFDYSDRDMADPLPVETLRKAYDLLYRENVISGDFEDFKGIFGHGEIKAPMKWLLKNPQGAGKQNDLYYFLYLMLGETLPRHAKRHSRLLFRDSNGKKFINPGSGFTKKGAIIKDNKFEPRLKVILGIS